MLFLISPQKTTLILFKGFATCSSIVIISAKIWVGWSISVNPFHTGTPEYFARSSTTFCLYPLYSIPSKNVQELWPNLPGILSCLFEKLSCQGMLHVLLHQDMQFQKHNVFLWMLFQKARQHSFLLIFRCVFQLFSLPLSHGTNRAYNVFLQG